MGEQMTFPNTWEEYEKFYGFTDKEQVYTNGSRLILSFRVRQWLDHLPSAERKGKWIRTVLGSTSGYGTTVMYQCSECEKMAISKYHYCPNCGADMRGEK